MENFFRHTMPQGTKKIGRFLTPGKYQGGDDSSAALLEALSGQFTGGDPLTGQMSSQDNASMMAASGLPTDVLKLGSPNQSTQPPPTSVSDLLLAMGLQNKDGSFIGGQSGVGGPTGDIGVAQGSMLEFLNSGGAGSMTNPFGYGSYDEVGAALAQRRGRGGRNREFGVSGFDPYLNA
jgi:hypothetical protein